MSGVRENHYFGTGNGCLSADDKETGKLQNADGQKKAAKANPKIAALQVELAHVDSEIEKLVDSLTGATPVRYLPCVVPCKLYFMAFIS